MFLGATVIFKGGTTDGDSLLESTAVAARQTARARLGYRRWRRPERGGRFRSDEAQRRWDAAMRKRWKGLVNT